MKPRLLNLLTALSLLLCVAWCALWARSYLVADYVHRVGVRREPDSWRVTYVWVAADHGHVSLTTIGMDKPNAIQSTPWTLGTQHANELPKYQPVVDPQWQALGFAF